MVSTVSAMESKGEGSGDSASIEAPVKLSVLEEFLSVRGLTSQQHRVVKGSTPARVTAEALSKAYAKRRHGQKTEAQHAALRDPEDVFSDSVDAYVPRKRQQELMNLHQDEKDVNDVFVTETRVLSFEREVLDKVVCDREENRYEFEEKLWRLMMEGRGLQEVEENQTATDESLDEEAEQQP